MEQLREARGVVLTSDSNCEVALDLLRKANFTLSISHASLESGGAMDNAHYPRLFLRVGDKIFRCFGLKEIQGVLKSLE